MEWLRLAACRYRFNRARFTETKLVRRIRPGQSIWSACQAGRANWLGAFNRRWADSRVVYKRHYDIKQTGGPLTADDLRLGPSFDFSAITPLLVKRIMTV